MTSTRHLFLPLFLVLGCDAATDSSGGRGVEHRSVHDGIALTSEITDDEVHTLLRRDGQTIGSAQAGADGTWLSIDGDDELHFDSLTVRPVEAALPAHQASLAALASGIEGAQDDSWRRASECYWFEWTGADFASCIFSRCGDCWANDCVPSGLGGAESHEIHNCG